MFGPNYIIKHEQIRSPTNCSKWDVFSAVDIAFNRRMYRFGPGLWVSYVLKSITVSQNPISQELVEVSASFVNRCNLQDVKVVVTEIGDHYNPDDRSVALTKDKFDGKTLASIVIAAQVWTRPACES